MSIKEIISDSRYYYVVYETYFGCDLFEYINVNVTLEEKQLATLFYEILMSIQYIHDNNINHK